MKKFQRKMSNQFFRMSIVILEERGYNAVNQIVGYLLSGDPAYIPRQNEARNQIRHIDRDVIMEELVSNYLKRV